MLANQLKFKVLAGFLALVLPVVMMPAGVVQAQERDEREPQVVYLDAEVRVIDGQPVLVYETEAGYEKIPFQLYPEGQEPVVNMMVDGEPVTVRADGTYLLIPTEEGIERVCVSEFDVVKIDGEVVLFHEVNPGVIAIIGAIAAGIAIGAFLHDMLTTREAQTVYVNRWIQDGSHHIARGFDFRVPEPLTDVYVEVKAFDIDPGERVYVHLVGGNQIYKLDEPLHPTGNDQWGETRLRVDRRHLDELDALFQRVYGKIEVKIAHQSAAGTHWVWIRCVEVNVEWYK